MATTLTIMSQPIQQQRKHKRSSTTSLSSCSRCRSTTSSHSSKITPKTTIMAAVNPSFVPSSVMKTSQNHFDLSKRQRRQAAGALVSGLFSGGANHHHTTNTTNTNNNPGNSSDGVINPSSFAQTDQRKSKSLSPPPPTMGNKNGRKSTAQPRPSIHIPPRAIGPIWHPDHNDVLCGRGGRVNMHTGNVRYRDIVQSKKGEYLSEHTKKLEKAHIACAIVRYIRDLDPPGRFLKEDPDGSWFDIGDAKAIKKVGQALREDASDVRIGGSNGGGGGGGGSDNDEDHSITVGVGVGNHHHHLQQSPPHQQGTIMRVVSLPPQVQSQPLSSGISSNGTTGSAGNSTISASGRGGRLPLPAGLHYGASPVLPSIPSTTVRNAGGERGGGAAGRGVGVGTFSGAAAAAMQESQKPAASEFQLVPLPSSAFGRPFHFAENEGSSISELSGAGGAPVSTLMSNMSGVSALTDPSILSGNPSSFVAHGDRAAAAAAIRGGGNQIGGDVRMTQMNQNHQQHPFRPQRTSHPTTHDGGLLPSPNHSNDNLKRQLSYRSQFQQDAQSLDGRRISWSDHSLMGGGLSGSFLSGSGSHNSIPYAAMLQTMSGNHHLNHHPSSLLDHHSQQSSSAFMSSSGSGSKDDSWLGCRYSGHPRYFQGPEMPPYEATSSNNFIDMTTADNRSDNDNDRSKSTGSSRSTTRQRNSNSSNYRSSNQSTCESVSMNSVMSELSDTLIALDLAATAGSTAINSSSFNRH